MTANEQETSNKPNSKIGKPWQSFSLTRADQKFLFGALIALFAVRLVASLWFPFVDTTEARYAEIARKMLETGDWITPQFEYDVPFWGKPPLHTWLSALGMKLFGVGSFGARVFIFATSLGVLVLVYSWVRQHRSVDQALVAVTVLASSVLFFGASAFVMTDMVMVLGTTLSMVGFYNCINNVPSRVMWGRLFFVGVAIGLLAKGPVALVITIIAIVPWLLLAGRWRKLSSIPWVSGLVITAILTLPWYLGAEIKTPGFLRYFIIGEHFERFVVSGWDGDLYGSGHSRPKGIIWPYWLGTFLPWTAFFLLLLPRARTVLRAVGSDEQGWYSYLLFWIIAPLILFTPAANLLSAYVLPGIPASAVLLVTLCANIWSNPGKLTKAAFALSISGVALLLFVAAFMSYYFPSSLNLKSERELVAAARNIDPTIEFTYWGRRSYSAEFYTHGKVHFATQASEISALSTNNVRDAVAVGHKEVAEVESLLEANFDQIGRINRRDLFIEKTE